MGLLDSFMPGETGGLPDGGYGATPQTNFQGILSGNNPLFNIGMGILANNSGHYGAFAPAIGGGVQQGIQNTQQAQQLAQRKRMYDMQIAEQQRKQLADKAYSDAISKAFVPASSAPNMSFMDANNQAMQPQGLLGNPTEIANPQALPQPQTQSDYQWNQTPASFDKQAMLNAVLSDPNIEGTQKFSTYQNMQKDTTPIKLGKGETLLNPTTYQPLYSAPNEPKYQIAPNGKVVDLNNPDTSQTYKDYSQDILIPDGQGGFKVNQPLLEAKKQISRAGASSVNINQTQEKEENKAVGKYFGEQYADIQKAGLSAGGKINRVQRLNQLLQGVDTGKFTPAGVELASAAQSLGLNVDRNLGNKQAAEALSNEMALELRNPSGGAGMPGAMSDQDRNFLKSMVPGIEKTPQGRRFITDSMVKMAKRDQDVARLARNYRKQNGTIDEGFYQQLQDFSDKNPLFPAPPATPKSPGKAKFLGFEE